MNSVIKYSSKSIWYISWLLFKKFTERSHLAKDGLNIRNIIFHHLISWDLETETVEEALGNINKNYESEVSFYTLWKVHFVFLKMLFIC